MTYCASLVPSPCRRPGNEATIVLTHMHDITLSIFPFLVILKCGRYGPRGWPKPFSLRVRANQLECLMNLSMSQHISYTCTVAAVPL